MPVYLEVADALAIHEVMTGRLGGLSTGADRECLDAALAMPRQSAFGEEVYSSLADKAAAYLFYLAKNHCFPDGNKRTAAAAALLFIRLNGMYIDVGMPAGRLARLTLDVVTDVCSLQQAARWFSRRLVSVDT